MKSRLLIILIAFSSTFMVAQKQQVRVADKFYKNYAYTKAEEFYKEAVKKGDSSAHVLTRLGDCYYNNSKSAESAEWYGEALRLHESELDSKYMYRYSQALRGQGNYEEAIVWLEKYKAANPDDDRIANLNFDDLAIYEQLSSTDGIYVRVEPLPINTKYAEFGAYKRDSILYFSSARDGKDKIYDWNGEPFLDLYEVVATEQDGVENFKKVNSINGKGINSEFHEANIAITKDGKTMYFTRDNVNKNNRLKTDKEGTSHLKIYKASYKDSIWQDIKELPFNDKVYSSGHPALSPDDRALFFVSDREGGYGETDIYKVAILGDDSYGDAVNLGPSINSDGKEMFPYVAEDNTLYFSSDSNINLGFLDIFKSDILNDSGAELENLGAPFNTGYDDFAFTIDSETENGYFSSNRPGVGSDDIYAFTACSQMVRGVVKDSLTKLPLPLATVKLIDSEGKILEEKTTDSTGVYEFKLKCKTAYTIMGTKLDYKDELKQILSETNNDGDLIVDLELVPLIIEDQIVINPIFFDFDKWNIRTDAQVELEHIVDVMRTHPNMVIKIESHTDSRGSDKYNMKLSDRRAKSTQEYLLSRGIAPERIESAIGYGETQLLNQCSNGVKCTEEEHQLNRRSYFYILSE
ncbi:OmpA family protein [Mangrovimonas sp. TPBH4]|uniref:OmpA family protein n=1 Tax=Mangrovimonas sp. TPBH4 TaxID=1645914 RepID=UPI0006B67A30|nr:OmpA family protein [Mangrovimonas sp. TPBH4]